MQHSDKSFSKCLHKKEFLYSVRANLSPFTIHISISYDQIMLNEWWIRSSGSLCWFRFNLFLKSVSIRLHINRFVVCWISLLLLIHIVMHIIFYICRNLRYFELQDMLLKSVLLCHWLISSYVSYILYMACGKSIWIECRLRYLIFVHGCLVLCVYGFGSGFKCIK